MATIVLDKCYLQAASWKVICDLAKDNDLVVTGSLFHELLSGDQEARRRVFAKLPRTYNPVRLIDNLSSLLAHEGETHTPAGNILTHTLDLNYEFNAELKEPGYLLPQEALDGVMENEEQTCRLVDSYIRRTNAVAEMFTQVTSGSDDDRLIALAEIEGEIADPRNVLRFYRSLDNDELPPANLITEDWATFRFYQTALLFSLHTLYRHRGPVPLPLSAKEFDRLEHDVHDHMALCLGILGGGLATNELKLQRWFSLLNPSGTLISS